VGPIPTMSSFLPPDMKKLQRNPFFVRIIYLTVIEKDKH